MVFLGNLSSFPMFELVIPLSNDLEGDYDHVEKDIEYKAGNKGPSCVSLAVQTRLPRREVEQRVACCHNH